MKNRIIGLGIFALIFSLNLFFSGAVEAKQASPEPLYTQLDKNQQEVLSVSAEINPQEGILQNKTESSESQHVVRKFPAALSLLFFLLNQHIEESPGQLLAAHPSFSLSKDLSISFHNLRI